MARRRRPPAGKTYVDTTHGFLRTVTVPPPRVDTKPKTQEKPPPTHIPTHEPTRRTARTVPPPSTNVTRPTPLANVVKTQVTEPSTGLQHVEKPLVRGNIDLHHRPIARNKDGSISTVRSITIGVGPNQFALIPTVVGGKVVSNDAAIKHFQKTGEHLGIFYDEVGANNYAEALHEAQAREYLPTLPRMAGVTTAKGHQMDEQHRYSWHPFFKGQEPAGTMIRRGKTVPYYKLAPGPTGSDYTQMSSEEIAQAQRLRAQSEGTAGMILRDVATSLVPKTLVDIGQGRRGISAHQIFDDAGNLLVNFTPGAEVLGVAAHGGASARTFAKAINEGRSLREAATLAARSARGSSKARAAVVTRRVERDVMPALKESTSRRVIHAQIDQQLPAAQAAKVKAALDDAAAEHAVAEARSMKGGTIRDRRRAQASAYYDHLLAQSGGAHHPVPGGFPRSIPEEQAATNLRQFTDPKGLERGAAQNDVWLSKHPEVGGHPVVGPISPEAHLERTQLAVGGDPELANKLAGWYRELGPMFETFFGEDAPSIIRGFAVSQANASPAGGLTNVLRVRDKLLRGEEISPTEISTVVKSIEAAVKGEPVSQGMAAKLHDFTDSLEGKTTRTWTGDDIRGGRPTAVDIHAQRDLGRVDPKILSTLRERHDLPVAHLQLEVLERELARVEKSAGPTVKYGVRRMPKDEAIALQQKKIREFKKANREEIAAGKRSGIVLDNPQASASGHSYNAALREYADITDHYNAVGAFGRHDWTPAEVQALGWSAIQRFHGTVPEDATFAIERNTHNITYEVLDGIGGANPSPESYREALGLTKAAEDRVREIVNEEGGIWRDAHYGLGGYEGATTPAVNLRVLGSPEQADRIASRLAREFQQWEVWAQRPGVTGARSKFAIELEAPELRKVTEVRKLWSKIRAAATDAQLQHLQGFSSYSYKTADGETMYGIRIVTGHGSGKSEEIAKRLESYENVLATAVADLRYDVRAIPNNVEVRIHDGQVDQGAAEAAGASGEPAVNFDPAQAGNVERARADTPLDPGTYAAEVRSLDDARRWQESLLEETGSAGLGAFLPEERGLDTVYRKRTLRAGDLSVQLPKARSRLTQVGERLVDRASKSLDKTFFRDVPGLRLMTSTERAVKGAGRLQRQESPRRVAKVARELRAISKLKEGSREDVAHFWYAQLPAEYRNAHGLSLIQAAQESELQYITSGRAAEDLAAQETALRAEQRQAETAGEVFQIQKKIDELKLVKEDLPFRMNDTAASIGYLKGLVEDPPALRQDVIDAMRVLAEDRQRILIDGGRLDPERAGSRTALLAHELGLEPDGSEVYVGHRLPKPDNKGGYAAPSGGTGRVRSPAGVGTRNQLVLARTGRLRATTRVSYEDWQSAQVFEQANVARDDLGAMGAPYRGGPIPADHVLVNPKGQTIPPHWRSDELAQFTDDAIERDEIREKAKDVLQGFFAQGRAEQQALIDLAYQQGLTHGDLRVVPKRLVDRYYSQFRSFKGRSTPMAAYDMAIDAVATSVIFFRIGYIPKNIVQNVVMAMPHQGAFFLVNASRAAQALADPELRELLAAEMAGSSATAALSSERTVKKGFGHITHFVTSVADEPLRVSAFLHEAAAEGVISRVSPLLGPSDREALLRLLKSKGQRARLNDIRSRSVDAMADFTRLTPDQARNARRLLVIPGWLMAGSRYPFHFAATHPIRSALMAYMAMGEPGAPDELHFNNPLWTYFHGHKYLRGIDTQWGRLRTSSLNPISTPWEIALAIAGSIKGKTSPFDFQTPTAFDEVNPLLKAIISSAQGDGVIRNLESLFPDYRFVRGMIDPKASTSYPDDATWQGRLEREFGIIPIHVNDTAGGGAQQGPLHPSRSKKMPGTLGGGSSGGMFVPSGAGPTMPGGL